jgi:putative MATE family efflux protein
VLADTAVVGHLGTPELGGLAVANTVLATLYAVFIFLAYGTTSAVARLIGAGDHGRAAHQAVQSMWLAALIGVALAAVGFLAAEPLVRVLGAEGAVATNALIYLRISLVGLPFTLLTLAGTGYLRGLQNTTGPLVVALTAAAFNLAFELFLIYGLGYGIGASALSTVVAEAGAASVYVWWVRRAVSAHDVRLGPDPAALRTLALVGRDLFIRTAALRGSLTIATAVAARIGTDDLAAHQIAFEIWSFLALALDAVAIAGQAIIGHRLGAGDADGARAAGRRMIEWGLVAGVLVGALMALLQPVLPELFTDDPAVLVLAGFLLWFVAVLQPVNGVVFVLDGILIGAGDLRFLAWAMVGALGAFLPAALAVLVFDLGIGWLWGAIGVLMLARLVALGVRFAGDRWVVLGAERPTRPAT